jgi:hypothetical protein
MKKNKTATPVRFGIAGLGEWSSQSLECWNGLLEGVVDAEVHCFSDGESLKAAARTWQGKIILFSNFPPDAVNGFTYNDSKRYFTELLSLHEPFDLHIVTNAGGKMLEDREVLNLSSTAHITIQRPWEWLLGDFVSEFSSYVIRRLRGSLRGSGQSLRLGRRGIEKRKRPKPTTEQLEGHIERLERCRNYDPLTKKPWNPNVDETSFRIWQKASRIPAARQYAERSVD